MKNAFGISQSALPAFLRTGGKRNLSNRDHRHLYERSGHKCEACGQPFRDERDMQAGHRKAYAKGGKTTLKNSVALCYRCNNDMNTQGYEGFMKARNWAIPASVPKKEEKQKEVKPKKKRKSSSSGFGFAAPKLRTPSFKTRFQFRGL